MPETTRDPKRRVLVLDDEERVAQAIGRTLEPDHDVKVMTRPRQALDALAAGESFDVILCDLVMPEMSGMDFYAAVQKAAPASASRIIFMTGGVPTLRARYFLEQVGRPCIEKPLDMKRLEALISAA